MATSGLPSLLATALGASPHGAITEFPLPTANSLPDDITVGPDGNLWFTEQRGDEIGRITPAGVMSEYPLPALAGPEAITAGPDGNLWFTPSGPIGRITPAGVITPFPLPSGDFLDDPAITAGPDGNLWFPVVG